MTRSGQLDRLRGLAVVLMIADHTALLVGGLDAFRYTGGRVAAPLFLVLAGHLAYRLSPRLLTVAAWGCLLTVLVPWAGIPSILLQIVAGMLVVVWARRRGLVVPALLVCLSLQLNGWGLGVAGGYPLVGCVSLMLVGVMVPRHVLERVGERLPKWLEKGGRYPLSAYVSHLLAFSVMAQYGVL